MTLGIFLLHENFHDTPYLAMHNEIELAVYAEELGFDEVWFAEHHFNSFSVIPNPSLAMAYLAAKTTKIRIGSAAFLAPFYHPVRLAEEIATLDTLSFGRINVGFAKGGFTLDMEHFEKSPQELREQTFSNVTKIDDTLHAYSRIEPKPLQKKIPFYIATFSTKESIEFAAKHGYGLMFSQGATIEECEEASLYYHSISGFYPEAVVMRIFSIASTNEEARKIALPATDYFVKCMQAVKSKKRKPKFFEENYQQLLQQRYEFFDAKKFMQAGIIGNDLTCIEAIQEMKSRIKNLHLVLKVASSNAATTKDMLRLFDEKVMPKI